MQKVAIIGAGPAGIFLSLLLKDFAGEITLFEKNARIGEKLRLTGGGRMNITNSAFGSDYFTSDSPRLLANLFKSPWSKKIPELLQELEIQYVFEDTRALLASHSAEREVERLWNLLEQQKNLDLEMATEIEDLEFSKDKFRLNYQGKTQTFDKLILCQGGMLRGRELASAQANYRLALKLGHSLSTLRPALHALKVKDFKLSSLAGLSFVGKLSAPEITGELLITHQGFSGPAALDFSLYLAHGNFHLSFLPELSPAIFESKLNSLRQGKNLLRPFLQELLPKRLASFLLSTAGIEPEAIVSSLGKDKLNKLTQLVFHSEFELEPETDYRKAWTTGGGIPLTEIKVSDLESKLKPGLYFAGETLDVNGHCGGYNLSFALLSAKLVSDALLKA